VGGAWVQKEGGVSGLLLKRNVEREKEEVLVRLIYKKTRASTSSAFNLIVFRDTYLTFA
jgi:hypothetical protein